VIAAIVSGTTKITTPNDNAILQAFVFRKKRKMRKRKKEKQQIEKFVLEVDT
jgi:hypothetical protein